MCLCVVRRMLVLMRTVVSGVVMVVHMGVVRMSMLVGMLMKVLMSMFMGVQMLMFVFPFHDNLPFYLKSALSLN